MNNLNSVLLEGNLTADPKLNITSNGTSVCHFSIATNRYYKKDDVYVQKVIFTDIEVWQGLADNCAQYLMKGRGVRVVGRIDQDKWIDKNNNNRTKLKIVGEHVEFKPMFSKTA
ncbi:MAG: single-stranded DNA-binding protein [Bacteroidota bacterium]|nr:single-stranded DNA-binding protein [Bacteroidota bacterium]